MSQIKTMHARDVRAERARQTAVTAFVHVFY